jgi:hypothetical protein
VVIDEDEDKLADITLVHSVNESRQGTIEKYNRFLVW